MREFRTVRISLALVWTALLCAFPAMSSKSTASETPALHAAAPVSPVISAGTSRAWSDPPPTAYEALLSQGEERPSAEAIFAAQSTNRTALEPATESQSVQQPPREARQTTPLGHAFTPAESAAYIARSRTKIQQGDIAGARRLLERASEGGEGDAICALAETYDPRMLAKWGVLGTKPDLALAKELYSKAASRGAQGAKERLLAIGN